MTGRDGGRREGVMLMKIKKNTSTKNRIQQNRPAACERYSHGK